MLFLSTFNNKIDKKGRVSVPSTFRSLLSEVENAVVIYESIRSKCLEGCSVARLQQMSNSIDKLDLYSDERDAFATVILGGSIKLSFDSEGRIILPEALLNFADLKGEACFVGKGEVFEIWNPKVYQEYFEKAKELANKNRNLLKMNQSIGQGINYEKK